MDQAVSRENSPSYGFGGRLTADFPSQVVVDTTEVCNLACIHCSHPRFKKSPLYRGRHLDPALNDKLVAEVAEFGPGRTQYLRYTGCGEPLLHPGLFEMLGAAVQGAGCQVSLTTNGTLLGEQAVERLLATGVDAVDVSLDAFTPETYAKIRVKGDLAATRAKVLRLIARSKESGSRTKVVVTCIEQPQNQGEIEDFRRYWTDMGADYVIIRRLHANAGDLRLRADQMRQAARRLKRRPCLYPWERIILNAEGSLLFCPDDWHRGSALADFRRAAIREVWRGEAYRRLREAHLANAFGEFPLCRQCPDWAATRWPWEGRSFADMMADFQETCEPGASSPQ
jgi:MoaA/NifB/PqqE/SkfB family radical SAM enzyme